MFRFWFQRLSERLRAQPTGWVSNSSVLAYGSQQARCNAAFFLRFHAPWFGSSAGRPFEVLVSYPRSAR